MIFGHIVNRLGPQYSRLRPNLCKLPRYLIKLTQPYSARHGHFLYLRAFIPENPSLYTYSYQPPPPGRYIPCHSRFRRWPRGNSQHPPWCQSGAFWRKPRLLVSDGNLDQGADIMLGGIVFQLGKTRMNIILASHLTIHITRCDPRVLHLRLRVLHPLCKTCAHPL